MDWGDTFPMLAGVRDWFPELWFAAAPPEPHKDNRKGRRQSGSTSVRGAQQPSKLTTAEFDSPDPLHIRTA